MAEKRMTGMSYKEMQELMNAFIDRSSSQYDELPTTSFFELLFEQMAQRTAETVEVEGEVVGGIFGLKSTTRQGNGRSSSR